MVFALKFFIHIGMGIEVIYKVITLRKVICVVKLKVIQPQPKYKTLNFSNLRSINKKLSSPLVDFCRAGGGRVNSLKNENS